MMTMISDDQISQLLATGDADTRLLAEEVLRLRAAIRAHREATGHELCWLNDVELWQSLGEPAGYPHQSLPVREEFLGQCGRFYESRVKGTPYQEPTAKETVGNKK